ncbi:hypothetical protein SDC9_197141 [bioreactor metagenome]|uniref:Uncharacterized protein n=1 Tax=bioreactor metagenome TaxID=1076179 RepID=A0A645IEG7_9ZZZZ
MVHDGPFVHGSLPVQKNGANPVNLQIHYDPVNPVLKLQQFAVFTVGQALHIYNAVPRRFHNTDMRNIELLVKSVHLALKFVKQLLLGLNVSDLALHFQAFEVLVKLRPGLVLGALLDPV